MAFQSPCHPEIKFHFLGGKWKLGWVFLFFCFFVMLRVSSHHSRLDQNFTKGRREKGRWSEASWWKQVTLFSLFPLSRQHLCKRCAFRKATAHTGFSNLGNRTQINYHQHTGHLQTVPMWVFKSIFFGQLRTKEMPFSVLEENKLTTSTASPAVASWFPRPSLPVMVWMPGHSSCDTDIARQ